MYNIKLQFLGLVLLCLTAIGVNMESLSSCNSLDLRAIAVHMRNTETAYKNLQDTVNNLTAVQENQTSLIDKQREQIAELQEQLNKSKDQQDQIDSLREQLNKSQAMASEQTDKLQNQVEELEKEAAIQQSLIEKQNRDINNTMTLNENVIDSFQEFNVSFQDLKTKVESFRDTWNGSRNDAVGFTAYNAHALSADGYFRLNFSRSTYISDDSFNMASGVFTCKIPGLYVFTATLVGSAGTNAEYSCLFYVNGVSTLQILAHDDFSTSYPSASGTVVFRLGKYDTVYLGSCTNVTYLYTSGTSFSGFLVVADNE